MDHHGFIHEKLDIKLLILFILSRLPAPIDRGSLDELCRASSATTASAILTIPTALAS